MTHRNNSHRAYLAREGRRQGKTAGRVLVGFFVFAALYNMGSHSKETNGAVQPPVGVAPLPADSSYPPIKQPVDLSPVQPR